MLTYVKKLELTEINSVATIKEYKAYKYLFELYLKRKSALLFRNFALKYS